MAQNPLPRNTPSLRNKTLRAFLAGCVVSGGAVALFHRGAAPPSELGPGTGGALPPPGSAGLTHSLKRTFLDLLLGGGRRTSQPSGAKDAESVSKLEESDHTPFASREEEDLSAVEGRRYKLGRDSPNRKSGLGTVLVGGVPAYRPTRGEVPGPQDAAPGTPGTGFAPAGARTAQDARTAGGKKGTGPGASSKGGASGDIQATGSRAIGGRGIKEGDLVPDASKGSPPLSPSQGTGGTSGAEASPRRACLDSGGKWQAGKCACPEGTGLTGEPGRCQVPKEARVAAAGCLVAKVGDSPVDGHCARVFCGKGSSCDMLDIPDESIHCNVKPGNELSCGQVLIQGGEGENQQGQGEATAPPGMRTCTRDDYQLVGPFLGGCGIGACGKDSRPKMGKKKHHANCNGRDERIFCVHHKDCGEDD